MVFLGGALAGAATALMFSPKCGRELRDSIKKAVDKEVDALRNRYNEVKDNVH